MVSVDENGRRFHVQCFIEGTVYDYNQAPKWLMHESAHMLAKIHNALRDITDLTVGIGAGFFKYRTPEAALKRYQDTIQKAIANGDGMVAEEIRSNMRILEHFPPYEFDIDRFTCTNTHGDFMITQLICGENCINSVTKRLLQNPKDFAGLFKPVFGTRAADRFEALFTQHLLIAADLVNAAKKGQTVKANAARNSWYKNADEIAGFLSSVNRCWDKAKWKEMLYSHLEMTEKEASLRLKGNYSADISVFDSIENEAFKIADYMFCGMIKTCP